MRRHELKECQKIIGDHIQKAVASGNGGHGSPAVAAAAAAAAAGLSPTPSPAGSEGSVCSRSSGYTSAGENGNGGRAAANTPPAAVGASATGSMPCLSVPHSVMQKQHQYCNYLSQCHELWEMADMYAVRGHCEGKFHDTLVLP